MSLIHKAYVEHQEALKRYLSRFFKRAEDVEDAAQDAFIRAFVTELRTEVRSPKRLLFRAAKHVALNEISRKAHKVTDAIEGFADASVLTDRNSIGADDVMDGRQKLHAFLEAVSSLPPACREAFVLRKFEGLSHKEIAIRMRISVSGVEKHIATGMVKCSRFLCAIGYDPREFGASVKTINQGKRKPAGAVTQIHDD